MKPFSDVIVVGGGPSGSFTALNLAKLGASVAVFEEHSKIGVPSHCPGHLSIKGLKKLELYPLSAEIVENIFYGAVFHSSKGTSFSVRFSQPVTCVVNRVLFDKYIAEMAEKAGVHYYLNSKVESLIVEDGFVKGVYVRKKGRDEKEEFLAKIVVDAEGISSRFLRLAGLSGLNRQMVVNGVEAEVENVENVDLNMVEVFFGKDYASGFYAWLIPKKDGKAKVGLAAKTRNPHELLQKFMLKHPAAEEKLRTAKILHVAFHPLTLGGPIKKAYSNGFLAVGDAASQVKPTTGGGVVFGMTSARIAADIVYEALKENDFSSGFLGRYQRRFEEVLGFDVNVMLRIRKMLDAMSDQKIDDAISLCKKLKLDETLQSFEDIDFQGQSLLRLLRSPKMFAVLSYFFLLYLTANV
ncbi:NAD(P)/FAD-dependent oxidoreductase [Candidatus Bathyarchaeota archaeon]|nr:NAD(P)/FAD-dependent oxidoreductase [Candidatus Bathyarchaeota archaeon]